MKTLGQILLSQPNSRNSLSNNNLYDFDAQNGTKSGQLSHSADNLYEALSELCERKKMSFWKPLIFIDYVPAKLVEGRVWYIYFYVKNPSTGKLCRQRIKFNKCRSIRERRKNAAVLIASINEKLALGWNPLFDRIAPKAAVSIKQCLEKFIESKKKEVESNSLRCYESFISIFKEWLTSHGHKIDAPICSISYDVASAFMNDMDCDRNLSILTYNNYLRFYSILFRWLCEKGYVNDDPFAKLRTKKVRRHSKKRRVLSGPELSNLWKYLEGESRGFLRVCLLCYCCLMRPKEIMLLKCSDIDLHRQVVNVRAEIAKNDHDSSRTIPDAMLPYFQDLDLSHKDWYVFSKGFLPGPNREWTQRASDYWRVNVRKALNFGDDVQLYSLKDTGITNMAADGVPVSFIQQQADHSSLAMTSIYCQRSGKATEELKSVDVLNLKE